ncbi:glycosyltransferase family 4 protein [Roseitranquillus sediminis]|uniref:glycosyltransferase family 4 protein n=1 Tax=Roseitranquillus sediminis TaxID=2809051 RepID=UPI001D0C0DC5|nr:glycosyltransferase family 4 protein [Roseitranquillus sediminis]MBM9594019.1 glycosyltransferase family 4 protein [Roseitranquillus sediminis]
MRVGLVSSGSGSRGGGEIYLAFLADGLAALGCEVTALVPDAPRMDELAERLGRSAQVTRIPFRTTYDRRTRTLGACLDRAQIQALATRFAALEVDVLHVNQQVAEDGLDLVQAAARSGLPWLSTIHVGRSAVDLGARFGGLRDRLAAAVLTRAGGHHVAVCEAARDQLAARFGGDAAVHVVHNGVPVPDPDVLAAARARARDDWGVREDEIVVGAVGRIEAQKGPLALIDHLHPFAGRGIRVVWIGDGTLRGELERHAAAAGVPLIVDGWRSDAATRLAGFDLFAMPSRFEGLPLAALEALHAGLPVVASRTDGMAEALRHEETGFLCASAGDWKTASGRLLDDAGLRRQIGAVARQDARARFSSEAMARATQVLYGRVCAIRGRSPAAVVAT